MNRCKRWYISIYKCLQYLKNRADILMQLNGTSAFWASGSPLEDYLKKQLLAAASFLWTMWRVFTSSQLFLEKNSAGSSTKSIHRTTTVRSKTPTLMCIQRVCLCKAWDWFMALQRSVNIVIPQRWCRHFCFVAFRWSAQAEEDVHVAGI